MIIREGLMLLWDKLHEEDGKENFDKLLETHRLIEIIEQELTNRKVTD
jgi:hypothetical protein